MLNRYRSEKSGAQRLYTLVRRLRSCGGGLGSWPVIERCRPPDAAPLASRFFVWVAKRAFKRVDADNNGRLDPVEARWYRSTVAPPRAASNHVPTRMHHDFKTCLSELAQNVSAI